LSVEDIANTEIPAEDVPTRPHHFDLLLEAMLLLHR
jgi:hypothetical protein